MIFQTSTAQGDKQFLLYHHLRQVFWRNRMFVSKYNFNFSISRKRVLWNVNDDFLEVTKKSFLLIHFHRSFAVIGIILPLN